MESGQAACARCPRADRCTLTPEQCTARMVANIVYVSTRRKAREQERDTKDYICESIWRMKIKK